jgi:hypothetical protein
MEVVSSADADALIEQQGGQLFVWPQRGRCCGSPMTLAAATRRPEGRRFRQAGSGEGFAVFVPEHLARLPDELQVAVRRRRVRAYWDGCVWIV